MTRIARSGDLYLVSQGTKGRLVNVVTNWTGRVALVDSILRMTTVDEPWADVPPEDCPAMVRIVAVGLGSAPDPADIED